MSRSSSGRVVDGRGHLGHRVELGVWGGTEPADQLVVRGEAERLVVPPCQVVEVDVGEHLAPVDRLALRLEAVPRRERRVAVRVPGIAAERRASATSAPRRRPPPASPCRARGGGGPGAPSSRARPRCRLSYSVVDSVPVATGTPASSPEVGRVGLAVPAPREVADGTARGHRVQPGGVDRGDRVADRDVRLDRRGVGRVDPGDVHGARVVHAARRPPPDIGFARGAR